MPAPTPPTTPATPPPTGVGFRWFNDLSSGLFRTLVTPLWRHTEGYLTVDLTRPSLGGTADRTAEVDASPALPGSAPRPGPRPPASLFRAPKTRPPPLRSILRGERGGRIHLARHVRLGAASTRRRPDRLPTTAVHNDDDDDQEEADEDDLASASRSVAWWQQGGSPLWRHRAPLDASLGLGLDLTHHRLRPSAKLRCGDHLAVVAWPGPPHILVEGSWRVPSALLSPLPSREESEAALNQVQNERAKRSRFISSSSPSSSPSPSPSSSRSSPLRVTARYTCPLQSLSHPLDPPASLDLRLAWDTGPGIFLTPGAVEVDWRAGGGGGGGGGTEGELGEKGGMRVHVAGAVAVPKAIPVPPGEPWTETRLTRLRVTVPW